MVVLDWIYLEYDFLQKVKKKKKTGQEAKTNHAKGGRAYSTIRWAGNALDDHSRWASTLLMRSSASKDTTKGIVLAQAPHSYKWLWDGGWTERWEDVRLSMWNWWCCQNNPRDPLSCYQHPPYPSSSLLPGPLLPALATRPEMPVWNVMLWVWLISLKQ